MHHVSTSEQKARSGPKASSCCLSFNTISVSDTKDMHGISLCSTRIFSTEVRVSPQVSVEACFRYGIKNKEGNCDYFYVYVCLNFKI